MSVQLNFTLVLKWRNAQSMPRVDAVISRVFIMVQSTRKYSNRRGGGEAPHIGRSKMLGFTARYTFRFIPQWFIIRSSSTTGSLFYLTNISRPPWRVAVTGKQYAIVCFRGYTKSSVFWALTQRVSVWYRRFGTTYRTQIQESWSQRLMTLEDWTHMQSRNVGIKTPYAA